MATAQNGSATDRPVGGTSPPGPAIGPVWVPVQVPSIAALSPSSTTTVRVCRPSGQATANERLTSSQAATDSRSPNGVDITASGCSTVSTSSQRWLSMTSNSRSARVRGSVMVSSSGAGPTRTSLRRPGGAHMGELTYVRAGSGESRPCCTAINVAADRERTPSLA